MRLSAPTLALLLVLSLAAGACGVFGGSSDGRLYEVEFERAFNLFEGSRVRVQGVDVGSVERVDVEPGGTNVVAEVLIHDENVRIPEDAEAIIVQGALLGERYVQFHPPYEGGPELEDGARIPVERTSNPVEFDESFAALNDALEALDKDEVARLIRNVADMLEGQGDDLGTLLEDARDLISALENSDEEIVDLVTTLADLQETVSSRAEGLAQQYVNLGRLAESLASERAQLDRALEALLRMTTEVGDVVTEHRDTLEQDIATLTRLGRTTNRNLDRFAHWYRNQAELFRHAARGVAPPERNWGTTRNHYDAVPVMMSQRINERLARLCELEELAECANLEFWEEFNVAQMCLPPLFPCPDGDESASVGEQLQRAFEEVPELPERLAQQQRQRDQQLLEEIDDAVAPDEEDEEERQQEEQQASSPRLRDSWETRVGSALSGGLR